MKKMITFFIILSSLISFGQTSTMEELNKLYFSHDYKTVMEKVKPLFEKQPNNIELNLMMGRTCADMGKYKEALPYLEFTVKNDVNNTWCKAWALNYLGTCHFMFQEYDEAEKSFLECISLKATKNVTNDAYGRTLLFGFNGFYANWKIVETEHFRFHFQNRADADIEKYIDAREKAYEQINNFFKSTLPKKIDFFVWESREDAKTILKANLGFANPPYCMVHTHYEQTVGHEMTHVISHYTSQISSKTRFINEGTAVCFDLETRDRLKQVKDWTSANNKQVAIREFWDNGNNYAEEILYPLSGLFVKELIANFGKEKFLEFFKNQSYDHARLVFGDKLEKLILEFDKKINS